MPRVTFRMPAELAGELERLAASERGGVSAVLRDALTQHVAGRRRIEDCDAGHFVADLLRDVLAGDGVPDPDTLQAVRDGFLLRVGALRRYRLELAAEVEALEALTLSAGSAEALLRLLVRGGDGARAIDERPIAVDSVAHDGG